MLDWAVVFAGTVLGVLVLFRPKLLGLPRSFHGSTLLGFALLTIGLTAPLVLRPERMMLESGAETDETASCAEACGDQAAAGCWCDDQCADYGDCCPDKAVVCDGAGGGAAPASGEPGAALGSFELTYYWITEESAFGGSDSVSLYDDSCHELSKVPQGFADAIKLEGTGRLTDGTVLNYSGSCGCPTSPCYFAVDAEHPWGQGVQSRALVPFRSVAVDKSVVPYGSSLYIEQLDGVQMPGEAPWGGFVHDGCVSADDTGSAIIGKQSNCPRVIHPSASKPMCWSGSRKNSTAKRMQP